MPHNVHHTHIRVNSQCAWAAIGGARWLSDNALMRRTFLREWRKASNRTLVQVAEELRITHQQLGKIERGQQPYNQKLLEFLADLYGCDEADLIMRPPGHSREIKLVWDQIPEHDRERALAVLEAFIPPATRAG